jgi:putative membrane protein
MFGHENEGFNMMGEGYNMMGFGWIFVILVIIILVYIFKNDTTNGKKSTKDILDERYAKGEIDVEEYKEKKKILEI